MREICGPCFILESTYLSTSVELSKGDEHKKGNYKNRPATDHFVEKIHMEK